MEDWLTVAGRSFLAITALFILTRLMGKRQLSQMTFFEYAVGITIGSIAGIIALDLDGSVIHGLIAMVITALFPITLELLSLKSKTVRIIADGTSTVLIKHGHILENNLRKERMTSDELLEHLRLKNIFRLADVEFAMMEASGRVSVLLKQDAQPVTPAHLQLNTPSETEPETVIEDGVVVEEALLHMGLDQEWLAGQLQKKGLEITDVYLAQVDVDQQLYLDLYKDRMKKQ